MLISSIKNIVASTVNPLLGLDYKAHRSMATNLVMNITVLTQMLTKQDVDNVHKIGVYKIFHISNPELFYIGSTGILNGRNYKKGFYRRLGGHLTLLKCNKHKVINLQNIVNTHGLSGIRFTILKLSHSKKEALDDEQYFFDLLKPALNKNLNAYSAKGYKHSAETRAKSSLALKGRVPPVMSEAGRKSLSGFAKKRDLSYLRTPEMIKKQTKHKIGFRFAEEVYDAIRKEVHQYNADLVFIKSYPCMLDAAKENKIDRASISKSASGQRRSAGGFIWKLEKLK